MKIFTLIFLSSLSLASVPTYRLELESGKKRHVEFLAFVNPGKLKIRGQGTSETLTGNFAFHKDQVQGKATFPLDSLDTGISLRNQHMKEKYLETAKFPMAEFQLQKLTLPADFWDKDPTTTELPFEGTMALHGVQKPLKGSVHLQRAGQEVALSFQFDVKLNDFSITAPSFMGVRVSDTVQVLVEVTGSFKS